MLHALLRTGTIAAVMIGATTSFALAATSATPAPPTTVAQSTPAADQATAPLPTPNPFSYRGFIRSYYFTRQNAFGFPGTNDGKQVNQASWNSGIDLHADYHFAGGGWYVGGSYFGAEPFSGPCGVAANNVKTGPRSIYNCIAQKPPSTNPDNTLPGFALSTFPEAYLGYKGYNVSALVGDQLFNSPWAGPYDATRLKPVAYQGADVSYALSGGWSVEGAYMDQFQNRTSSVFCSCTLLTGYPAGNPGMASNIIVNGAGGISTNGFYYGKLGYAPKAQPFAVDGYFYGVLNLLNMGWFDGKYSFNNAGWKPYVALQGGIEGNAGASYIGKINSSVVGAQLGATPYDGKLGNVLVTVGFDSIPWQSDSLSNGYLKSIGWGCNNTTFQLSRLKNAAGKFLTSDSLPYFLPINTGQCLTSGSNTSIDYGGWASPYTDAYATDPLFTTMISQGMADRRAPGSSEKLAATYTSANKKWTFIAAMAWYNYGNAAVAQSTNEWNLDGTYKFSAVKPGPYRGLMLRYRYAQRTQSNAFFANGSGYLGGLPMFKYNRAQLEYDF